MSELPRGWAECELNNCVSVLDNLRVPVNSEERKKRQGEVPYYGATGRVGWIDDYLFDEELLLIGEDGAPFFDKAKPIAYIIHGKSWVNNHAHVLRALPGLTSNLYLKYFLDQFDFHDYVNGTTRLKLTQGSMNQIPVKLAPLNEQNRIVAKLQKLLSCVDAAQARLAKIPLLFKRFRQSILAAACSGRLTADWRQKQNAPDLSDTKSINLPTMEEVQIPATWNATTMDSLLQSIQAGSNFACVERPPHEDEIGVLKISAVTWGKYDESQSKTCGDPARVKPDLFVHSGDFLFTRANTIELVGACVIVEHVTRRIMLSDKVLRLSFKNVEPRWVLYFLRSSYGRSQIEFFATGNQQSMRNIGQEKIRKIVIPEPPPEEQKEMIRRVEELLKTADSLEARYHAAKAYFEKLTQSILACAFRGELVLQDPNDEPASAMIERIRRECLDDA